MAVHADAGLVDIGDAVEEGFYDPAEFIGKGKAHSVGNIDGGGSGLNSSFNYAAEVIDGSTSRILTGEFHVIGVIAGIAHVVITHGDDVIEAAVQLVLDMDVGGGDKGMNTEMIKSVQSLVYSIYIFFNGT